VLEAVGRQALYRVVVVLDDAPVTGGAFQEIEVLGGRDRLSELAGSGVRTGFVAIGDNLARGELSRAALDAGLMLATVVHPGAHIARTATIGAGTVIMPGAVVGAGAHIAEHVILNTGCSVDHDSRVEHTAHVSPGVHVSGGCTIGSHAHLGIGASVVAGVTIGERARVGAGAAVLSDVPPGAIAVGVPARAIEAGVCDD
jgi:sugar O-acyltransferase (sialic acid O-acetyltransferase NeuD family)